MNKNILLLFIIMLTSQYQTFAHTGKPKYHLIIDTDGAIDDLRAISMLLAGNECRVLAITCSQGTLSPKSCYDKVNSLLSTYYHNGIPIGIGEETKAKLPDWNPFSESIIWGENQKSEKIENASDLLEKTMINYPNQVSLIALGSMKTYADWLRKYPDSFFKIKNIIWYNDTLLENGFNYMIDKASYDEMVNWGIPIQIISNGRNDLICNNEFLKKLERIKSIYTQQIFKVHKQEKVAVLVNQNHLHLWDDLVPLYLTAPMIFNSTTENNITHFIPNKSIPQQSIYDIFAQMFVGETQLNNRVFKIFPTDTFLYKDEYASMVETTIEKHGETEWKSITLTNEIHGHTGIYSIVGAKMGIRALEYFNVGVNNLKVNSFAGKQPPLSCLNDGIQISTGATIGQGLISISKKVLDIPTVVFECNGQKVKISLKESYAKQMQDDITNAIKQYGMTDQYWLFIEKLAIKYWLEFDRHEMFDFEKSE